MLRELKGPQIEDVPHADVIGPVGVLRGRTRRRPRELANWRSVIAWGSFEELQAMRSRPICGPCLTCSHPSWRSRPRSGHGLGPDGVPLGPTAPEPPGRKRSSAAYAWPRGPGVWGSA